MAVEEVVVGGRVVAAVVRVVLGGPVTEVLVARASTWRAVMGRTACSAVCSPARRTAPQATAPVAAVAASHRAPKSRARFTL